jgi:hypothetical protein
MEISRQNKLIYINPEQSSANVRPVQVRDLNPLE